MYKETEPPEKMILDSERKLVHIRWRIEKWINSRIRYEAWVLQEPISKIAGLILKRGLAKFNRTEYVRQKLASENQPEDQPVTNSKKLNQLRVECMTTIGHLTALIGNLIDTPTANEEVNKAA